MNPKITLTKEKERGNREIDEKAKKRKKNDGCALSFYVGYFGVIFDCKT